MARPSHEASRSESESEQGEESRAADAKPGELPMVRLRRGEDPVEGRTHLG